MGQNTLPQAAVFDLDGVVTFTARVHAAAWKELFDFYLRSRQERFGGPFRPFDADRDYRAFVDGRPRYEGVRIFLESRGVHIPYGHPTDAPTAETVCGLGNRKNDLFVAKTHELGVDVDHEAVRFIRELRDRGIHVGLASSSKNAAPVLERVGLLSLFEAVVDGLVSERLGLRGKPEPDIFLKCLELLTGGIEPSQAMVIEDAVAGVEAGKRGAFGLVLGVDRHGEAEALRRHGADWVISDFREISAAKVAEYFRSRAHVA
ncbi:MAG: HAD family hydrolase [Terriglobales bacterium]